jgi:hypothetical protein
MSYFPLSIGLSGDAPSLSQCLIRTSGHLHGDETGDKPATPTRENRTITVDFHDEATYFQLLGDTKAFLEFVLAFILSVVF